MSASPEEITGRFEKSWTETEFFYENLIKDYPGFQRLEPLREFIATLRANGESSNFRLGTSVHFLIISRSVDRELRSDQKNIKIEVIGKDDFEVILRDGYTLYRQFRITSFEDPRLETLLRALKDTLID